MKLLITADLHLNLPFTSKRTGQSMLEALQKTIDLRNPDGVVIAGDIGVPEQAHQSLAQIREVVGDRFLALTLGNHDFWLDSSRHAGIAGLHQVIRRYWREPVRDIGATLLELENADLGEVVLVGCYGHYDLGHAVPGLCVDGVKVTQEDYLFGGIDGLFWNDFRCIPNCASRLAEEAAEQAAGLASRMDQAIQAGKRVLVITHTCPWLELNAHPRGRGPSDVFAAYSGNSLIGKVLSSRAGSVDFHCCGHTHRPVELQEIQGVSTLNIGADYGVFRGILYDTTNRRVVRVGEPI